MLQRGVLRLDQCHAALVLTKAWEWDPDCAYGMVVEDREDEVEERKKTGKRNTEDEGEEKR